MAQHLIRNIFDQYRQPENRLTHALVQVLARDADLTRAFVRFATGQAPPKRSSLSLSCQLLPGEAPQHTDDEDYASQRGLPDAWIFDEGTGWALVCECKVTAGLGVEQLRRHASEARRRGFDRTQLLVITADESEPPPVRDIRSHVPASWVRWPQVFEFFTKHGRSQLVCDLTSYIGVLEAKLMTENYEGPPLTKFTGVPFGAAHPYSESEAKVILRALMGDLRARLGRSNILAIDPVARRPALVGSWDIVGFNFAVGEDFTRVPHLTMAIGDDAHIQLTLPNSARSEYWRRLRSTTPAQLGSALATAWQRLRPIRRKVRQRLWEPRLILEVLQRHYYTRRDAAVDGRLSFDLEVLLGDGPENVDGVRKVPAWLEAAHSVLAQTHRANFQVQLQARYPVVEGSACRSPEFVDALVHSAEAFHPFLVLLRGQSE